MPYTNYVSLTSKSAMGPFYTTDVPLTREEAAPAIAREKTTDVIALEGFTLNPENAYINLIDRLVKLEGLNADLLYNSHTKAELKKLKYLFRQVVETAQTLLPNDEKRRKIIEISADFASEIDKRIAELKQNSSVTAKLYPGSLDTVKKDLTVTFGRRTFVIDQACYEIGNSCLQALDTQKQRHYYVLGDKLYFKCIFLPDEQTHIGVESVKFSQNAAGKFMVVVEKDAQSMLQAQTMTVEENQFDSLDQIALKTIEVLAAKEKGYAVEGLTFSPIRAPSDKLAHFFFKYRTGSIDLLAKDFQQKYLAELAK